MTLWLGIGIGVAIAAVLAALLLWALRRSAAWPTPEPDPDSLGHLVDVCDGQWIDVSTLVDTDREMCNVCRATRRRPPGGSDGV